MYQVKSPILFLIFNRPKETQLLFNAIREAKPKKLYVAADGPRNNGKDDLICKKTKDVLNQIDWDCELITLFRKENLGCGKAVSSAITWFFENEEEGIILEDDCLPSADFFRFTDEMLDRYRTDDRIGHICGCNFQEGIIRGEGDYYYSKLTHVWGWASWRRVWNKYDFSMNGLETAIEDDFLAALIDNKWNKNALYNAFTSTKLGEIDTWDYQYMFLNQVNSHLSVIPNYNMISNIGFNADGTHTFDTNSPMSNVSFNKLPVDMEHPRFIFQNRMADKYTLDKETPSLWQIRRSKIKETLKNIIAKTSLYKKK
jgi:hypothetical protein